MSFKSFDLAHDVASLVSAINEVVSISSSIYSNDLNVKFFKNISSGSSTDLGGYWETVYDSSPTGSLSTALLDLSFGYATGSSFNGLATASSSQNEKIKLYRQFASVLLGNPDSLFSTGGTAFKEAFFILVKRNVQKDEIKKGALNMSFHDVTTYYTGTDSGAATNFKQTVGGDYSEINISGGSNVLGTVWYNAGVIVVNPNMLANSNMGATTWSGSKHLDQLISSGSINNLVDGLRTHVDRIDFHNQTNLFSTIYFCRATNTEFNYSSNPTFVDDNKRIRVTSGSNILQTRAYVTTIGLYDANDNLLAAAKVNKPITKSPDTEATFRVRLDY